MFVTLIVNDSCTVNEKFLQVSYCLYYSSDCLLSLGIFLKKQHVGINFQVPTYQQWHSWPSLISVALQRPGGTRGAGGSAAGLGLGGVPFPSVFPSPAMLRPRWGKARSCCPHWSLSILPDPGHIWVSLLCPLALSPSYLPRCLGHPHPRTGQDPREGVWRWGGIWSPLLVLLCPWLAGSTSGLTEPQPGCEPPPSSHTLWRARALVWPAAQLRSQVSLVTTRAVPAMSIKGEKRKKEKKRKAIKLPLANCPRSGPGCPLPLDASGIIES